MWPGITKAVSHTHKHHYKSPNVHEIEKKKNYVAQTSFKSQAVNDLCAGKADFISPGLSIHAFCVCVAVYMCLCNTSKQEHHCNLNL